MDERCDADVILDVVFERGLLFLVLENTGDLPAHGVRVKFGERFTGIEGAKRIDRLALFLDRSASYFARDQPTTLTASVSWRTSQGERRRATIVHDLEIYRDLGYI